MPTHIRSLDILPVSWNTDINNNIDSQSLSNKNKQIASVQSNALCSLFDRNRVKVSADDSSDTVMLSTFSNSFAYKNAMNLSDLQVMATAWNTAEDDADVIDAEFDDELLSIEESYIMISEDDIANYNNTNEDNDNESVMILDTLSETVKPVSKPKIIGGVTKFERSTSLYCTI